MYGFLLHFSARARWSTFLKFFGFCTCRIFMKIDKQRTLNFFVIFYMFFFWAISFAKLFPNFLEVIFKQFLVQNQFLLRKLFKWRSFTLLLLRTEPFLRKRITSRLEDVRLLWRNLITSIKAWGTSKKGHQY